MKAYKNIDEYIANFPIDTQKILTNIRKAIKKVAPMATETISYGIPTFDQNGHLVHFAAYKEHIGFYPTPSGLNAFRKALSEYKMSKGAVQFPLDKPIPINLIKRIVEYRVMQNTEGKPAKTEPTKLT